MDDPKKRPEEKGPLATLKTKVDKDQLKYLSHGDVKVAVERYEKEYRSMTEVMLKFLPELPKDMKKINRFAQKDTELSNDV